MYEDFVKEITDLRCENSKLKISNNLLQQRIDKAIEYIEYIGMDATFDKVLIEILKGEDK